MERPISLAILGWLFVVLGSALIVRSVVQLAGDFAHGTATADVGWVLGSGVLAALGGACLVRGSNWGRWLCAAWMGAHVIVSLGHSTAELVVHALFFAAILAIAWRPASSAYFAAARD